MRNALFGGVVIVTLVGCGGTKADVPGDAGSDAADAGGTPCDPSAPCGASQFCKLSRVCGAPAGSGVCQPFPPPCSPQARQVCGANGTIYPGECYTQQHGTDLSDTACGPQSPDGTVRCGWLYCNRQTEYCAVKHATSGARPGYCVDYECAALPTACKGSTSCSCFPPATACLTATSCTFDGNLLRIECP